tara:strand:- start:1003 stop:1605 length:603 start_codon:yes stop_codon:yes gene_type:complete
MSNRHKIVLATHNLDKQAEMNNVLSELGLDLLTLNQFPEIGEIQETGTTLLENSFIKARTVFKMTGLPSLADDTGLEVDALNGAPGVFSSRYAGENVSYEENVNKILDDLKDVPPEKRGARFKTVISFVTSSTELSTDGHLRGVITTEQKGLNGFGYDPVFLVNDIGRTLAEISPSIKNEISHRAIALKKMKEIIKQNIK